MVSVDPIMDGMFTEKMNKDSFKSLKDFDINLFEIFTPSFNYLVEDLSLLLDSSEIDRAKRFYRKKDENRFIICRSILKLILSHFAQSDISKIKIDYLNNKKPYLPSHPQLFFNLSHSHEHALIAITTKPIGVDIEHINESHDVLNSISQIFNTNEALYLKNSSNRKYTFYKLWTRKEAFAKALGIGINNDFFKIPSLEGSHKLDLALFNTKNDWLVRSFNLNNNYVGAVAYEAKINSDSKISTYIIPNNIKELIMAI